MAQPITDDELKLRKRARRRLVGAIALVLIVVVVLPWVVDDDPPPKLKNVDISIPATEPVDRKFGSAPAPEAPPVPPAPAMSAPTPTPPGPAPTPGAGAPPVGEALSGAPPRPEAAPPQSGPEPKPETVKPEPKADAKPESKPAPKVEARPEAKPAAKPEPKPASPKSETGSAKGFVMQLGAFTSIDKARMLQQQLKDAGFPSYLEPVKTPEGTRTRVRAGPYPSIEAAQKARARLVAQKLAQGEPKIVPRGE